MQNASEQNRRPQFTGHETFTLRYGWLKKAYDAVKQPTANDERSFFLQEDAAAKLGVGKNMVSSMRHWATVSGVIKKDHVTKFGDWLLEDQDPLYGKPLIFVGCTLEH